jgi:hypothetical protein
VISNDRMDYTFKSPMRNARKGHSVCCVNNEYLVVLGSRVQYTGNTCELYNIEKDEWQDLPSLLTARNYHSSCALADKVYVFFGV